jgi:hypothetical protein
MAKRDLLKMADDFEGNLRALLATPPVPNGTAGSRKAAPKRGEEADEEAAEPRRAESGSRHLRLRERAGSQGWQAPEAEGEPVAPLVESESEKAA